MGRSHHVWKQPELLPWLERNALAAVARVDAGDPDVEEFKSKRKTRRDSLPPIFFSPILKYRKVTRFLLSPL